MWDRGAGMVGKPVRANVLPQRAVFKRAYATLSNGLMATFLRT
jgi:hypothetical protein